MTDKQQMVAAFVAAMIGHTGTMDVEFKDLSTANQIADLILKGETEREEETEEAEGGGDHDASEEVDETEDDVGNEEEDETEEVEEEDAEDSEAEEDEEEEVSNKKPSKKSAPSTAAGKAGKATKPAPKEKKKFKVKAQAYARENDAHREIFSGILKAVAPKWKADPKMKARAKDVSVKLEGEDFLDAEGDVLESFKQAVKKLMAAKK